MSPLSITWLGHATFLLQSPGGRRILFDPWVTGNPASPESAKKLGALDLILVTHGHSDHVGDAVAIGRCGCGRGVSDSGPSVTFARPDRPNVSYNLDYDLGHFDDETCRLEPIENPFSPKVLPMSPE